MDSVQFFGKLVFLKWTCFPDKNVNISSADTNQGDAFCMLLIKILQHIIKTILF